AAPRARAGEAFEKGAYSGGLQYTADRCREPRPVCCFLLQPPGPRARERVELRGASRWRFLPGAANPALVFQLVQRRVERPVAHLQRLVRLLPQPLRDRPTRTRLQLENLQNQQVQRSLDQCGWPAHRVSFQVTAIYRLPE